MAEQEMIGQDTGPSNPQTPEAETNLPQEPDKSGVQREDPDPDASRRALVKEWEGKILGAKSYWDKDFKRIREDMQLGYHGATKEWAESDSYIISIVSRYINQVVATLYAKNPTAVVEKRKRLDYVVWDGRGDTLAAAMNGIATALQTGQQPDPNLVAIVKEVSNVQQHDIMLKRVMKTLEIVLQYYYGEQSQNFKGQLKQLVRRVKTCGIGYVYLGYQRKLEKMPEITAKITDVSDQIAKIQSLAADKMDGVMPDDSARLDELKSMLEDLQAAETVILREGPVFDFPRTTEIIIDTEVKQLNGLIGAGWVAREFFLATDKVQEVYNVDLTHGFASYTAVASANSPANDMQYKKSDAKWAGDGLKAKVCVWEVWNKENLQTFTMIEGYPDFVKAPTTPDVPLKRFWPIYTLVFNDVEHEIQRYPLSDVRMLKHPQMEYNRSREMRRLHRKSNSPAYVSVKGKLDEADKAKLSSRQDFALIELNALNDGESVDKVIQVLKGVPFDQAMYETKSEMDDVLRTVGAQEANIGGTNDSSATQSSIAENSRISSADSNADDLSEFLCDITEGAGEMCLLELDVETVKKIVGPGAQWPHLTRTDIVEQVSISVKAGSSGRPNKGAELANLERALPFLQQMSGVKMDPIAEKYADLLDIDYEDLIEEGLPSQVALNAMASRAMQAPPVPNGAPPPGAPGGAMPGGSPSMQGPAGVAGGAGHPGAPPNMPQPGPQAAHPAPMPIG